MTALWERVPVIIRAILLGLLVNEVGQLGAVFIFPNLKLLPRVPWMLAASAAWLWGFWRYVNGSGWPQATRETRRRDLRATPITGIVWRWSLLAGGLGLLSVAGIFFLTPRLAEIPRDAFKLSIDISNYPPWTVVSILLVVSVVAGVAEEAGFRGYMLSQIERRHGWIAATIITAVMFSLAHYFGHAYAKFPAFLPFFLAVSVLHARLVYLSGSILPSIVLHAAGDFAVVPFVLGLMGTVPLSSVLKTGVDSSFILEVALTLVFAAASVPAFRKLAEVTCQARERHDPMR
jgi:membrane protease YdiL (CAAX protease family)